MTKCHFIVAEIYVSIVNGRMQHYAGLQRALSMGMREGWREVTGILYSASRESSHVLLLQICLQIGSH